MENITSKFLIRDRINYVLSEASKCKLTYICAPVGYGKTVAVKHFEDYLEQNMLWIDCNEHQEIDIENAIKNGNYIVIDNFSMLKDKQISKVLNEIEKTKTDKKFIIISRKEIPQEYTRMLCSGQLSQMHHEDLSFNKEEIKKYLTLNEIKVTGNELKKIFDNSYGYPIAINMLSMYLKKQKYNADIWEKIRTRLVDYIETVVFDRIDADTMNFILKLSLIKNIKKKNVSYILEMDNAEEWIKKTQEVGSFFTKTNEDTYCFADLIKTYMQDRACRELDKSVIERIYRRGAEYYEKIEKRPARAAEYYILLKEYDKAANILNSVNIHHLGIINNADVEKFILQIPEEVVKKYPNLCINLAHIYRINNKKHEANFWIKEFNKILEDSKDDESKYNNLKQLQTYYTICGEETTDIKMYRYLREFKDNAENSLQDITITGNQPSIISGGKDLSNIVRHSKIIYKTLDPVLYKIFKEKQQGVIQIVIAENLYLNNRVSESIEYVTKAFSMCENIDNLFVAYSLLDKIEKANLAESKALEKFKDEIEKKHANYLMPNYEARLIENEILYGNIDAIKKWVDTNEIDIIKNFNLLERYRYFTQVRAFIALGKYTEALIVLERLNDYIECHKRRIHKIEYYILKSICLYFLGKRTESLKNINLAVELAERNKYVRLFADEGYVVYQILKENMKVNKERAKSEFYKELLNETKKYGEMYPEKYARSIMDLTHKELEILKLIEDGLSNKEISEKLSVSLATVKTHINHIYSKLNTKNRVQTINKLKNQTKV